MTSSTQAGLSILDFVEQFVDVETRWLEEYEELALDFLRKCARLQADTLCKASRDLETPSRVLIALSLRCLMLTREAYLMDPWRWSCETPGSFKASDGSDIEVRKEPVADHHESHTQDRINGKSFSQSLEELLHLTQNLMMRRKPKDWPMVLFSLCLLRLTIDNCYYGFHHWTRIAFNKAFHIAYRDLCALFDIISKGLNPLCNKWNKEAYSGLVGDNDNLVGAFQWMHDRWLEGAHVPPMKCPWISVLTWTGLRFSRCFG